LGERQQRDFGHTGGKPILFLPSEPERSNLPVGWTEVTIDGETYLANFVKVALNVVRKPEEGETENQLPSILRRWFGSHAGAPGTLHSVALERENGRWHLRPNQLRGGM
jgi:hypothetical protein